MGAMRQKIGHRERLRVRESEREATLKEIERKRERRERGRYAEGKAASRNTGLYKGGRS